LDAALLHRVVDEAIAATGADMGNLQMADPTTGTLRIVASRGFAAPFLSYFSVVRGGDGSACGAAFKRGDRIIVPDVRRSDIFAGSPSGDVLREAGVHAVQSTPLLGPGGRLIGIVSTHRRSVWCPSDRELARLDAVVRGGAEAIDAA
jgi:GAF domain-containing protein